MGKMLSVILIMMIFINSINVYGKTKNPICVENIYINDSGILEQIGKISIKNSVIIDGEKNLCYPTFNNKKMAMDNIKIKSKNVLLYLSNQYKLDELSDSNWEFYYMAVKKEKSNCIEMSFEQTMFLLCFFDIYENEQKNDSIITAVEKISQNIYDADLMKLPYNSPYVAKKIQTYSNDFNVNAAVDYAKIYAVNPNTDNYGYLDADCTNFASQIMENGGIQQEKTWSKFSGWWHDNNNAHEYSYSWTSATKFCYYHVVDYQTKSHYEFTCNLQKGDFICLDIYNDLDWDHVGFVVEVDNYLTDGYYDYRVAQHSDNYLAWTSSDINHWEQYAGYSTYGIIRK